MAERPILFSSSMVLAILSGRKTVTRRLVKPAPMWHDEIPGRQAAGCCPYGTPNDRLWVRETWRAWALVGAGDLWRVQYAADGAHRDLVVGDAIPADWTCPRACERGNAPGIHMPRWASRLTLEVVSVRVERLHDITEEDILLEGVTVNRVAEWCKVSWSDMPTLHDAWRVLWNHINGAESWDANPWVWRVEFRRLERQP